MKKYDLILTTNAFFCFKIIELAIHLITKELRYQLIVIVHNLYARRSLKLVIWMENEGKDSILKHLPKVSLLVHLPPYLGLLQGSISSQKVVISALTFNF